LLVCAPLLASSLIDTSCIGSTRTALFTSTSPAHLPLTPSLLSLTPSLLSLLRCSRVCLSVCVRVCMSLVSGCLCLMYACSHVCSSSSLVLISVDVVAHSCVCVCVCECFAAILVQGLDIRHWTSTLGFHSPHHVHCSALLWLALG
jgi:hypothetical protein